MTESDDDRILAGIARRLIDSEATAKNGPLGWVDGPIGESHTLSVDVDYIDLTDPEAEVWKRLRDG